MKTRMIMICSIALTLGACGAYNQRFENRNIEDTKTSVIQKDCTQAKSGSFYYPLCLSIASTYVVMFDSGSDNIKAEGHKVLDAAMADINTINPRQVTISAFPDTSDRSHFNQTLAKQRELAIANALMQRGIAGNILGGTAYGETRIAVDSKNGVEHLDNRHVLIDFRR